MRLFEVLLLTAALPLAFVAITAPALLRKSARLWLVLIVAALGAHFLIENVYWQVAPAYIACALLGLFCLIARRVGVLAIRLAGAAGVALLLVSAVSLLVVPKFRLPAPTGDYAVGTTILHFVDPVRADATFKSGKRELMVQAWYPADQSEGRQASYRRRAETTLLSSYDAVLPTHSYLDAAVAHRGRLFPIILFNPSWNGQRTQNTFQMEDLASHGFVILAVDHPHNSSPVAFPDRQLVLSDEVLPIDDFTGVDLENRIEAGDKEVRLQAGDDRLALDLLSKMAADPTSGWYGTVDLNRVGAFGHSFGGAVAVETAFEDTRVVAAMNLDGWEFGEIWQRPLLKPQMVMYENDYPPSVEEICRTMRGGSHQDRLYMQLTIEDQKNVERSLAANGGYEVFLRGANHMDFSDRDLYSPLRRFTNAGEIKATRAHEIINAYTLAFFSQTLKGTRAGLLQQMSSPYPEVRMKIWPRTNHASNGSGVAAGSAWIPAAPPIGICGLKPHFLCDLDPLLFQAFAADRHAQGIAVEV